ncbi:MAG: hypothetical protein NVSMB27_08320 [Ktedonobacteraceae bacterium]
MSELLQMWALVEVLGFICLPLTITVLHNLPDRGWVFSKAIGMALLAFCVWFPLMTLRFLPFSQFFIAGVLLILVAFNLIGFIQTRQTIVKLVRVNFTYIMISECVFFGMMFLLGWIRSYVPDIRGFEMFMDEGFIAAIMRSPHLPPNDMWLSGYSINYYYFAHFTIVVLAKLLGQSPSVAFNTGICTFYGLTAVNLFGITCNIVSWARHHRHQHVAAHGSGDANQENSRSASSYPPLLPAIPYGFLTMLMALVLGNLAATQQWWEEHGDLTRFDWFWQPTRVVDKTINEFPAFSFLLSCFHAHVLTLAFTIVAIALAFNLFLEQEGKGLFVFGRGWRLPLTMGTTALMLGGLFTMNGWDFPTYVGLALICIVLQHWLVYRGRICLELLLDVFTACAGLVALSFILYAPFYLNFISPSQGLGIVGPADRSPLSNEILIYGLFAFVFLSLLLASVFKHPFFNRVVDRMPGAIEASCAETHSKVDVLGESALEGTALRRGGSGVDVEWGPLWSPAGVGEPTRMEGLKNQKSTADDTLPANNESRSVQVSTTPAPTEHEYPHEVSLRPPAPRRSWLNVGVISVLLVIAAALLIAKLLANSTTFVLAGSITVLGCIAMLYSLRNRSQAFVLLLGSVAFGLVAICEVFFLKDVFAGNFPRMNSVFKFYFQAWALLSITSGAGLYFILESFRPDQAVSRVQRGMQRGVEALWAAGLLLLLLASATYPLVGTYARTNHYLQRSNSLDGIAYLQTCAIPNCDYNSSGDYYAIRWLNSNVSGDPVIVEAVGDDYSSYGRVSAFTGLPSPMGWVGHEYEWRVNWLNNGLNAADFDSRKGDVDTIYTNPQPGVVMSLLARYHVQYLYVGLLEQQKYPTADLHRFSAFMHIVYSAYGVTIYQVN